jgi:methionyl-tRNA formyltransferase
MVTRVVFFGTPAFAAPALTHLLDEGYLVVGVVTQPDRPRGRGHHVSAAPVKALADARGLPVTQPTRLSDPAFLAAVRAWQPDLGIVAAYGRLLPQALIDIPPRGLLNVHASLLPRWRGAAPVHRAVIAGDQTTGVTIMRVVLALDAGPMLAIDELPIGAEDASDELEARLSERGARLLMETIGRMNRGPVDEIPQDDTRATYAARLTREDSHIDWARPATRIHDQIRGLHPWPLAAARLHGRRVILRRAVVSSRDGSSAPAGTVVEAHADRLVVSTSPGLLQLTELQPEGGRALDARAFLNGARVRVGDVFTSATDIT